jgi:hypothetical protein
LAAVYGIAHNENQILKNGVPPEMEASTLQILGLNLVVGAAFGVTLLYVSSYPLTWMARALGGLARPPEVRKVLAWASVPYIPLLVAFFFLALTAPPQLLIRDGGTPYEAVSGTPWILPFVVYFAMWGIMTVWVCYIGISGFSEVNRFGVGKAILSFVVVTVVGVLVALGAVMFFVRMGTQPIGNALA